ncbi:UDP-N-acetylmuramoyl-L-alanyl-D-glutamate--2,6-diaminopimelate ligase [Halonatronum saccharophilum]|uniref:UDP-N-acetylmuramoyl-L-alanyl-D-glutamate--2, 6-diaminopimelate ligase n=1 Tax=Halonatronum saccharophilum TaxID=150060 RepID=UPI0004853728|nr:UDP-N-acetylmuramoyl-L-alanyl-D-glutamate--2,6-diaminopimelate ligase [Halonatronum saccharophilum]
MVKLQDLVKVIDAKEVRGDLDLNIKGISYDSREVSEGYLFVAIKGFKEDGHQFIDDAIKKGANGIIVEKDIDINIKGVSIIKVDNSRQALSKLAAKFYDYPSRDMTIIGVTGTNGKTTTTYLIESVLKALGNQTGLIGTIKNKLGSQEEIASRTTPESVELQEMFRKMSDDGVKYVIMEVSSHALELDRVLDVEFDRQIFTNLSQDHLDFHQSFDDYLKAKAKLFGLGKGRSIINIDDEVSNDIISAAQAGVLTYGISGEADLKAEKIDVTPKGVFYKLKAEGQELDIKLKITGRFNVYNSLAAIGTLYSLGFSLNDIKEGLEETKGVPGRFQLIDRGQDFGVIVDYAHTPDGMENVLHTVKEITKGRKIVIFGCGGDRDKTKRPIMGKVGVTLGDFAIITSDNPRSEEPLDIIEDILEGVKEVDKVEGKDYMVIENRKSAIEKGIKMAKKDDTVVIIGKGHETYQIIKGNVLDFDDREVAKEALVNRGEE